jgi:hypothetical protein
MAKANKSQVAAWIKRIFSSKLGEIQQFKLPKRAPAGELYRIWPTKTLYPATLQCCFSCGPIVVASHDRSSFIIGGTFLFGIEAATEQAT